MHRFCCLLDVARRPGLSKRIAREELREIKKPVLRDFESRWGEERSPGAVHEMPRDLSMQLTPINKTYIWEKCKSGPATQVS